MTILEGSPSVRPLNLTSDVPMGLTDIDEKWLTGALRSTGVLTHGEVAGFSHRIVGEETGFLGEIAIVSLTYNDAPEDAPSSIVIKLPSSLKNRVTGQLLGVYEREIRFYSSLGPMLGVKTPHCYFSALSKADDPDVIMKRLKRINTLPLWIIALVAIWMTILYSLTPRRYVLVIEDLSDYRLGDQAADCSEDDVKAGLRSMAKLHARFWESPELAELKWIGEARDMAKISQMTYLQAVDKYLAGSELTEEQQAIHAWLKKNGTQLAEQFGDGPQALLHGDFRLDNMCFSDDSDEALIFDWQTMSKGSIGLDLSYFLSVAIPASATEETVNAMIDFYRSEMAANGVNIDPAWLRHEYELGMLAMLHRISPILFQEKLEMGSGRGPEIMQRWIDNTYARLKPVEFDSILNRTV